MGLKFNRQKPIFNYIVDFYCPVFHLVIEIDGPSHTQEKFNYDKYRESYLKMNGYEIIRFSEQQVTRDIYAVLQSLENFVNDKLLPSSGLKPQKRP